MKSIKADEFFKLVAANSGIHDVSIARDVFYGMVRTMSRELKSKHVIKLPDWGEFRLKIHKSRNFVSVNGERGVLPPKPVLKFVADHKVKKYFHAFIDGGTVIE